MASKVVNAPPLTVAVDKLNTRVTAQPHQDAMQARMGVNAFEARVVQEQGTH